LRAKALAFTVIAEEIEHGEMPAETARLRFSVAAEATCCRRGPQSHPSMKLLVTLEPDETGMLVAECRCLRHAPNMGEYQKTTTRRRLGARASRPAVRDDALNVLPAHLKQIKHYTRCVPGTGAVTTGASQGEQERTSGFPQPCSTDKIAEA